MKCESRKHWLTHMLTAWEARLWFRQGGESLTLSRRSCMGLLCLKHCWMGDLNPPGTTAPLSSPLGGVSCDCAAPQLKDAGRGRMCLCFGLSLFLPVRVIPIRVSPQPCSCLQDLCSYSNPGLTAGESPLRGSGCAFPGEQQNVTAESEAGLCHICHSPPDRAR